MWIRSEALGPRHNMSKVPSHSHRPPKLDTDFVRSSKECTIIDFLVRSRSIYAYTRDSARTQDVLPTYYMYNDTCPLQSTIISSSLIIIVVSTYNTNCAYMYNELRATTAAQYQPPPTHILHPPSQPTPARCTAKKRTRRLDWTASSRIIRAVPATDSNALAL